MVPFCRFNGLSAAAGMSQCADLYEKATNNPAGLRFAELCQLAACHGFAVARKKGSHHVLKKPGYPGLMVFQEGENGKAIAYQVRQLLKAIESQSEEASK